LTSRLKNPVSLRLGLNHSWKTKKIAFTRGDVLPLFHHEQRITTILKSLFRRRLFKKQSILYGHHNNYNSHFNGAALDIYYFDNAFYKIFRESRIRRPRIPFPRVFTLEQLKEEAAKRLEKETNKKITYLSLLNLRKELNKRELEFAKKKTPSNYRHKSRLRSNRRFHRKRYISLQGFAYKIIYILLRKAYMQYGKLSLRFFLSRYFKKPLSQIKVNLIPLTKLNFTIKMLMSFFIKKLFLRFTLFEVLRPFLFFSYYSYQWIYNTSFWTPFEKTACALSCIT